MITVKIQSEMMTMHNVNLTDKSIAKGCATKMTTFNTVTTDKILFEVDDLSKRTDQLRKTTTFLYAEFEILEDKLSKSLTKYKKGIISKSQMNDIYNDLNFECKAIVLKLEDVKNELRELTEGKYHPQFFRMINLKQTQY